MPTKTTIPNAATSPLLARLGPALGISVALLWVQELADQLVFGGRLDHYSAARPTQPQPYF